MGERRSPSEAGIPRPAPSAADLPEVVRAKEMTDLLRRGGAGWLLFAKKMPDLFDAALDALLARCEEAEGRIERSLNWREYDANFEARIESAEARVAELEAALHEITCIGWARPDRMVRVANDALAGLASSPETTT